MSIYKNLIDAVDNGYKFKVDLIEKSLWINKKQIIKKGKIVDENNREEFINPEDLNWGYIGNLNEEPWKWVEFLYSEFEHSAPNKNYVDRSYFKALSLDELSERELAFNIDRYFGQAMLEGYVLLASLQDWLKWEFDKKWFYHSVRYNNLVVLRNWVE